MEMLQTDADTVDRDSYERSLAARLVSTGKLDTAALERALRLAAAGDRIEDVLTRLGLVQERDVAQACAEELNIPLALPDSFPDEPVFEAASPKFLRKSRILPIGNEPDRVILAMADPLDAFAARSMSFLAGKPVSIHVAAPSDLEIALDRLYGGGKDAVDEIMDDLGGEDHGLDDDVGRLRDLASEAPVIRLVNSIISRAVESRASDIHIEPCHDRLRVRYRVDGALREVQPPPARLRAAVASRIKIMAKLNIAERRLPQDGRIRIAVRGKDYDLRVATVPQLHGEAITMRVLDRESLVSEFSALGFAPDALDRYLALLDKPEGIVLVTGPTGSGKTTTLYASLQRLNRPERKIFTVEDPIEYQLDGINQIQVKSQIGLTFAEVLRTLLRHNPNIIMVGEMRDLETAQVAIQASLTGHLVLSTLHTNGAAGSVTRLLDMKVEDYLVTSTLAGVTAQRLVRKLCPGCRRPKRVLPELARRMGFPSSPNRDILLYEPVGCPACHGSGYHGQIALIEVLVVTDEIRRLVLKRAEALDIHRAAVAEGMCTMYQDGVLKALNGITTIEEVLRVTRDV
ncbi:GspE/PulE family protein [Indioceanicola profundi]|uniref:GspE/PulE family protein n=1 Tax=Indioceanicola profundi TaxID=2220096 RepID=UPI001CED70C8|nr:ATPase, T2SS/T4P/T4SS family [Indioceanicola profundi]